ncbi:MAG: diguanylate cyclase [Methylovulum sp.]|nr:diguanylate cyclase [Methylovulum sp.]
MDAYKAMMFRVDILVMLIDDQAIVGKLIQTVLSNHTDISFHYCHNPEVAIDEAVSIMPTVILLDLLMPNINGLELLKKIRQNEIIQDIPVIMLSTEDEPHTKVKAFECGANDYLVKLPDKVELVARLRYHSKAFIHKLQRDKVFEALQKTQAELEKQNIELLRLSQLDGMTDIANRRYFDECILIEMKRAVRNQLSMAVVMLDIDHFKPYNDTYGHLQGDDCLRKVANIIKQQIHRPADLIARYGGEEFVLLLPETGLEGALAIAESICKAIANAQIPHESSTTAAYVTASLGVTSGLPISSDTPEQWLHQADAMLYKAKALGRNQVQALALQSI